MMLLPLNPGNSGETLLNLKGQCWASTPYGRWRAKHRHCTSVSWDRKYWKSMPPPTRRAVRCSSCEQILREKILLKSIVPTVGPRSNTIADAQVYEPFGIPKRLKMWLFPVGLRRGNIQTGHQQLGNLPWQCKGQHPLITNPPVLIADASLCICRCKTWGHLHNLFTQAEFS